MKEKIQELQIANKELEEKNKLLFSAIDTYQNYCTNINKQRAALLRVLDNNKDIVQTLIQEIDRKEKNKNMCSICGESFKSSKGLSRHKTMAHKVK